MTFVLRNSMRNTSVVIPLRTGFSFGSQKSRQIYVTVIFPLEMADKLAH